MGYGFRRRFIRKGGAGARVAARVSAERDAMYEKSNAIVEIPVKRLNSSYRTAIVDAGRDTVAYREKLANALVSYVCGALKIPVVTVKVLEVSQPHSTNERGSLRCKKMGDYSHMGTMGLGIRIWNLTAVKKQRVSNKTFLNTLLHELCHHIDCAKLGITSSPHTAGFYKRISHLDALMSR